MDCSLYQALAFVKDGGAVIWPHRIGHARAKQHLMMGHALHAAEAKRIGSVNRVAPQDAPLYMARDIAECLKAAPRQAIRTTKWAENKILCEQVNLILDTSLVLKRQCLDTDEHKAAARSFLDISRLRA